MILFWESLGILIGFYSIYLHTRAAERPARFLVTLFLISASSWISEESCIRLYHFYEYSPKWHFFVGKLPLLVIVIWPVIMASATEMISGFNWNSKRGKVLAGAAIVATDALLIEPLSASSGLWQWFSPGIFGVPLIGILGWFFFALLVMWVLQNDRLREKPFVFGLVMLALPPIGCHLLLLFSWWGVLRWITVPLPIAAVAGVFWCVSLFLVGLIHKKRIGQNIKKRTLLMRLPAAVFFFVLFILKAPDKAAVAVYAFAFVPPYITMMIQQYQRKKPAV